MKWVALMAVGFLIVVHFTAAGQIFKTSLTVTVRDELGNTVDGASLKLFVNEDDYKKETNVVAEATSDAKGIAKFKDLKPLAYFIIVRKGDKDNAGGGEQINKLDEGRINKTTVVIQ